MLLRLVVMNDYEKEFEESKTDLERRLHETEKSLTQLEAKHEKTDEAKQVYKKDALMFESQVEKLQKKLQKIEEDGAAHKTRAVQLEIRNEELKNETRHLGYIIQDLELKFDTQLEEIELLQNELEEQKTHSDEQIERQKQQLIEITGDLQVKERELKMLKFKSLFENPASSARNNKKQGNTMPNSARATFHAGRATTKNSQDFSKKFSLLDIPASRNGKIAGANDSFNF